MVTEEPPDVYLQLPWKIVSWTPAFTKVWMTSFEHDPPAANVQRVSETIVSPEAASKKVVKLRQVPTTLVAPVPPPPEPPPAKPGPPSSRPPCGHAAVTPAAATTANSPSRARLPPRRRASPPGSPRRCRAIASPS